MRTLRLLLSVALVLSLCFDNGLGDEPLVIRDEELDLGSDCFALMNQGQCRTEPEKMMKYCRKSCANYNRSREKYDFFTVSDDEESFFELSAKTVTGETLDFERFEGYVTMVINMAKLCKSVNPNAEIYFARMEDLQKVWPYSFELIVFPFEHPKFDYANEDCADFEEAARRPGRSIHVMETANIHVPVEELHPVYKYMMGKAKFDKLDVDVATFFVVNPEGSRVEVHQGTSLTSLKRYLHRMFETEL